jgi:hypothetical protein
MCLGELGYIRKEEEPTLAFALCYVAAHLALDLLNEQEAGVFQFSGRVAL